MKKIPWHIRAMHERERTPENADKIRVSLLMVHTRNHLMSAIQTLDLTERMISLYIKKD